MIIANNFASQSAYSRPSNVHGSDAVKEATEVSDSPNLLDPHRTREITFIGLGSSIAYQLCDLCNRFDQDGAPSLSAVTIIGMEEPWSESVRGPGYIHHQTEIIDHWSKKVPGYNQGYMDRGQFSEANLHQVNRAKAMGAEHLNNIVHDISRLDDGCFRITLDSGRVIDSRLVILGAGAGSHTNIWHNYAPRTPAEARLSNITLHDASVYSEKILDLDTFTREANKHPEKFAHLTIVVQGSTAGANAVELGASIGADIIWFSASDPVLMDGNHLEFAPELAQSAFKKINGIDIYPLTARDSTRLKIAYTTAQNSDPEIMECDYFVYALGQDVDAPQAAASILGDLVSELEPIYDYNQIYSDAPFKTVLGLQSKNTTSEMGLLITGAAAAPLSKRVQHSYLDHAMTRIIRQVNGHGRSEEILKLITEHDNVSSVACSLDFLIAEDTNFKNTAVLQQAIKDYLGASDYFFLQKVNKNHDRGISIELENQALPEVASVIASPQLATVKSSTAALFSVIPPYLANGENNFTIDNRTLLRAGIADRYPDIDNATATAFIEEVITLRTLERNAFLARVARENPSNPPKDLSQIKSPVHGTPETVRVAYEGHLKALEDGASNINPLSRYWLDN